MLIVSSSSSCCVTCGQLAAVLSSKRALVAEMPPGGQAPEAEQDDNGGPFQEVKGKKGKHKKAGSGSSNWQSIRVSGYPSIWGADLRNRQRDSYLRFGADHVQGGCPDWGIASCKG
jgi:hypothetical protein